MCLCVCLSVPARNLWWQKTQMRKRGDGYWTLSRSERNCILQKQYCPLEPKLAFPLVAKYVRSSLLVVLCSWSWLQVASKVLAAVGRDGLPVCRAFKRDAPSEISCPTLLQASMVSASHLFFSRLCNASRYGSGRIGRAGDHLCPQNCHPKPPPPLVSEWPRQRQFGACRAGA